MKSQLPSGSHEERHVTKPKKQMSPEMDKNGRIYRLDLYSTQQISFTGLNICVLLSSAFSSSWTKCKNRSADIDCWYEGVCCDAEFVCLCISVGLIVVGLGMRSENVKVCVYGGVCVCVWACLPACVRACVKLLLVGPSMTAKVGAIICSAVISINTFLDAHTLSRRSCAQHPPRM